MKDSEFEKNRELFGQGNPSQSPMMPEQETNAEQERESRKDKDARNATASNRERMVDIGRGNQQAGRQGK